MDRRDFLKNALLASAGTSLGACASIDRPRPGSRDLLRVDAHCHIFNGEDLDTLGYISQHRDTGKEPNPFVHAVETLERSLISLVKWKAPGRHAETRLLDNLLDRRYARQQAAGRRHREPLDRKTVLSQLRADFIDLNNLSFRQSLRFRQPAGAGSPVTPQDEVDRAIVAALDDPHTEAGAALRAIQQELAKGDAKRVQELRRHPLRALLHPYLGTEVYGATDFWAGFLGGFLSHRIVNAIHLMERFPAIDLFVAATLDVDFWFQGGVHSSLRNPSEPIAAQAEIAGKIAILTEGAVLPRAGFDPLRQFVWQLTPSSGREPAAVLAEACQQWACLGAKLYPVVGFRPYANAGLPPEPPLQNKDYAKATRGVLRKCGSEDCDVDTSLQIAQGLDRALHRLYQVCREQDCTVMAHTSHSNGGGPKEENRTGPEFFAEAARRHAGLRLQLGHMGGLNASKVSFESAQTLAPDDFDAPHWPARIAQYFGPEREGLYADIAFTEPSGLPLKNLTYFLKSYPASHRKILYGSDWHEVLNSPMSYGYYQQWDEAFRAPTLRPHAERVLGQNAADFLGLRKGRPTRARLEKFFAEWRVEPAWRPKVDRYQT